MRFFIIGIAALLFFCSNVNAESNSEVAQKIIQESITTYSGNCPCPYNRDRAGRRCGKRSAYSRPGGESPICYEEDVTQEMIEIYQTRGRSR